MLRNALTTEVCVEYLKPPLLVWVLKKKPLTVAIRVGHFCDARVAFYNENQFFPTSSFQAFWDNGTLQRPGSQAAADSTHRGTHVPRLWEIDGRYLHHHGAEACCSQALSRVACEEPRSLRPGLTFQVQTLPLPHTLSSAVGQAGREKWGASKLAWKLVGFGKTFPSEVYLKITSSSLSPNSLPGSRTNSIMCNSPQIFSYVLVFSSLKVIFCWCCGHDFIFVGLFFFFSA